jgi:hypothetical protein
MHAAVEARAEHKDTALAGRAPRGDHCWQATVRLRQTKFGDFVKHGFYLFVQRSVTHGVARKMGGDRG